MTKQDVTEVVNNGGRSMEAAMWSVLLELCNISTLKEGQTFSIGSFPDGHVNYIQRVQEAFHVVPQVTISHPYQFTRQPTLVGVCLSAQH